MKSILMTAAAVFIATVATASAADFDQTYNISASGFTDSDGVAGPIQQFDASYTLVFDPSGDVATTTTGLTVNYNSLPYASEFAYAMSDDDLSIGSNVGDGNSFGDPPNSYGLFIYNATSTSAASDDVTYTTSSGDIFNSSVQIVTLGAVSAAPEPSIWLLMISGIAGIGLMFRQAKSRIGLQSGGSFAA